MWLVLVEFRSASSERLMKKERKIAANLSPLTSMLGKLTICWPFQPNCFYLCCTAHCECCWNASGVTKWLAIRSAAQVETSLNSLETRQCSNIDRRIFNKWPQNVAQVYSVYNATHVTLHSGTLDSCMGNNVCHTSCVDFWPFLWVRS